MSVGVLVITHPGVGVALLENAQRVLGALPLAARAIDVPYDCDPAGLAHAVERAVAELDGGEGVLLLTDLCGATPSNVARRVCCADGPLMLVAGVNLPMLIRVMNYAHLSLIELAAKAVSGGRDGVLAVGGDCA